MIIQKLNKLEKDLLNLQISWRKGTHKNYKRVMDANWVAVSIPNWRLAKKVGARKECYYGWILWSGSTNDNGTQFATEVSNICDKYDVEIKKYERQL